MEDFRKYQVRVKDIKEDSIEKCWIPLWRCCPMNPLDKEQIHVFIGIYHMSKLDAADCLAEELKDKHTSAYFINKAMLPRFSVKIDDKLHIWLSYILDTPGEFVMVFAFIKYRMHMLGLEYLEFDDFNIKVLPNGIPSKEWLQWLWNCQKLKAETDEELQAMPCTGNLLDCAVAYKSFL